MGTQTTITDETLQTFQAERISVSSDGTEANNNSGSPSISADGRYVAYGSDATNLVPGDTNGIVDIFVFDRDTNTTERVSVASDGTEANDHSAQPSISADGRFVTYASGASSLVPGDTGGYDIFVFDRETETTTRISVPGDATEVFYQCFNPSISADGRFITYDSNASSLVPGDTNGTTDVFVFDRLTNTTTRVSVASDGSEANDSSDDPSISADGRFVTYRSHASNLVSGDTNGTGDVFVLDRQTGTTTRVSVPTDAGDEGGFQPEISANGQFVSYSKSLQGVFVFDRLTNTTTAASEGTGFHSSISADGRFVTYDNVFTDRPNDTTDVFLFDRLTNTITTVSETNNLSGGPSISADGRFLAYSSNATNLVPGDTNGAHDIFVVQIEGAPPVDGVVKDGDDGNDILKGTHRNDVLRGHDGKDLLFGLKGDDRLDGGEGNDKIFAGTGDDIVLGGAGNDRIWTGKGSDLVIFNEGDGRDRVFDFDQRRHANDLSFDRVQLDVSIGSNHIDDFAELEALVASGDIGLSTRSGSLTLTFDTGDVLTLGGVRTLSAEDWLFV